MPELVRLTEIARKNGVPYHTLYTRASKLGIIRHLNPDASNPRMVGAGVLPTQVPQILFDQKRCVTIRDLAQETGINQATLYTRAQKRGLLRTLGGEGHERNSLVYVTREDAKQIVHSVRGHQSEVKMARKAPEVVATPAISVNALDTVDDLVRHKIGLDEAAARLGIKRHTPRYQQLMMTYLVLTR